jgi:hypothetical protein
VEPLHPFYRLGILIAAQACGHFVEMARCFVVIQQHARFGQPPGGGKRHDISGEIKRAPVEIAKDFVLFNPTVMGSVVLRRLCRLVVLPRNRCQMVGVNGVLKIGVAR